MNYAKVFLLASLANCASAGRRAPPQASKLAADPRVSYAQLLVAAQAALDAGHADAASTLAADACRLDADRPDAYLVRGQALAQNDHVADSSIAYERARALGCRDAALFMALASNYDVEHRYDAAVGIYLDYLRDHPHDAAMRDELALTYLLLGEADEAVAQLHLAARYAPNVLQIRQDLGYALLAAKSYAAAEATLAEVCQAPEAPPEARRLWAQALAGQQKWTQALDVVDALLKQYPLDRSAQALRGQLTAKLAPSDAPPQAIEAEASDTLSRP